MKYPKILYFALWLQIVTIIACKAQNGTPIQPIMPTSEVVTDTLVSMPVIEWDIDYIMGKYDPATHPDFVLIPTEYRDNEMRYLRKDVLESFVSMYDAALKDGIKLTIISATRNFNNQKRIWENKWTGRTLLSDGVNAFRDIEDAQTRARKILQYSSMPGTSRHHWGTDIDLNNLNNDYFAKGDGLKVYQWMLAHAHEYGFCQPYTAIGTDRNTGYFEEKWHWSYVPIASVLTEQAKLHIKNEMISGFLGSETAVEIDMLTNYMLGISPVCQLR